MKLKFKTVYTKGPKTSGRLSKADKSEAVIVLVRWKGYMTMHYIAGIKTEYGQFRFYNTGVKNYNDGSLISMSNFLKYLQDDAKLYYFTGVKGKKGKW